VEFVFRQELVYAPQMATALVVTNGKISHLGNRYKEQTACVTVIAAITSDQELIKMFKLI